MRMIDEGKMMKLLRPSRTRETRPLKNPRCVSIADAGKIGIVGRLSVDAARCLQGEQENAEEHRAQIKLLGLVFFL